MLKVAHNTRTLSRRRTVEVTPMRTSNPAAATGAHTDAVVPERMTERWKNRVEAEARYGLMRRFA